jgi:hypothetical protein
MFVQIGVENIELLKIAHAESTAVGIKIHLSGQSQNLIFRNKTDIQLLETKLGESKTFIQYGSFFINKNNIVNVHENPTTLSIQMDWPNPDGRAYSLGVPRMDNDLICLGARKK